MKCSLQRPDLTYIRGRGYAVHNLRPGDSNSLVETGISIRSAPPEEAAVPPASATVTPVYSLAPDGRPAVPTGRIFIRFAEGIAVESRRKEIHRAGYEVEQSLPYAPQAGWLRALSGDIADALQGIAALESVAGVENVEPQMLSERAWRR